VIQALLLQRDAARAAKNFAAADDLRSTLRAAGVHVNDRTGAWSCEDGRSGEGQQRAVAVESAPNMARGARSARGASQPTSPAATSKAFPDAATEATSEAASGGSGPRQRKPQLRNIRPRQSRLIHGHEHVAGRWDELGFVIASGGVRQALLLTRSLLADPVDRTRVAVLSVNRCEAEIECYQELRDLAQLYPARVRVGFALTEAPPRARSEFSFITVTFYANRAHILTRSP
jgi:hypothetical protein